MSHRSTKTLKLTKPNGTIRWIEIDSYLHSFIQANYGSNISVEEDLAEEKKLYELVSLVNPEYDEEAQKFLNRIADSMIEIEKLMDNHLSIEAAVELIIAKQQLKFNIPQHKEKFIELLKHLYK